MGCRRRSENLRCEISYIPLFSLEMTTMCVCLVRFIVLPWHQRRVAVPRPRRKISMQRLLERRVVLWDSMFRLLFRWWWGLVPCWRWCWGSKLLRFRFEWGAQSMCSCRTCLRRKMTSPRRKLLIRMRLLLLRLLVLAWMMRRNWLAGRRLVLASKGRRRQRGERMWFRCSNLSFGRLQFRNSNLLQLGR